MTNAIQALQGVDAVRNIATDPAYAATAAALYANAAIFRAQHASDMPLPGIDLALKPITKIAKILAVR